MGLYRGVMEVDILVVAGSKREANALMRQNFVEEAKNSLTKKRFEISEIFSAKWIPSDWIGCLVYNKEGKEIRPEELFPDDQEADPRQLRMF